MKRFLCALASCLVVAAAAVAADDDIVIQGIVLQGVQFKAANNGDKIDKAKLVGTWEAKKVAEGLPKGTWEFDKDGTVKISTKVELGNIKLTDENGNEIEAQIAGDFNLPVGSGEYKADGNKLTITLKKGEKETTHKVTITKLTDKEFQIKDEKGKVSEFTKKTEE